MNYISPEDWKPCDGISLETAAECAVKSSKNVLVIAGPGAGKTELLAQKAAFLLQTNRCRYPQKILAISFKKDAAQNLLERVTKRCGEDSKTRFSSLTYDAFSKTILDHFIYALPEKYRPNPNYLVNDEQIIAEAFYKAGFRNPNNLSSSKLKLFYDRSLSGVNLSAWGNSIGERVWILLLHGFDGYQSTLSFKMIGLLADYIIQTNPKIKAALQQTYNHVFLDEFQDTTTLQYAFVNRCFAASNTIVTAVGDHKQRIMLWAGAMKGIFKKFYEEYAPEPCRLTMNHRSAPRLVDLQKEMYASLNETKGEVYASEKWNPDDGDISLAICEDDRYEATAVSIEIIQKINDGVHPSDICILCKQLPENYSKYIIDELNRNGIRARIENEYQDLIKEPIIELIIDYLSCAINRRQPQKWESLVNSIMDIYGCNGGDGDKSYNTVQECIYHKADDIREMMISGSYATNPRPVIASVRELLDNDHIKSSFPEYRQGQYLDELIVRFNELFERELIAAIGDWESAIRFFVGENSIPIMTIHKSKGLEYSAVFFIGLEDSAFWNFKYQPEEDRCAFFVALSRAKRSITFTFCNNRSTIRTPRQTHNSINEFFELLQKPGMAKVYFVGKEEDENES